MPDAEQQGDHRGAAQAGGFSLHAGIDIEPGQRQKLERLCRYVSRPPVAVDRMALTSSGQVRYSRQDAVSRWHHAHCAGATGPDGTSGRIGATPTDASDAVSRGIRTTQQAARSSLAPGAPLASEDLAAMGISADLGVHYVRTGWLTRLARGVFCGPNDPPALHPSLLLLQRRIEGLHVGGKSALDWHGVRQYVAQQIRIYNNPVVSQRLCREQA